MIKFLDLTFLHNEVCDDLKSVFDAALSNSGFIGGNAIKEFEAEFAKFVSVNNAIAVANGTDALEIAIEALNLPKGSEVIIPANSFISTAECIVRNGLKVVFCDVCEHTYNLSVDKIERQLTANTSAIIPVHLYGHPCDMEAIMAFANKHDLRVVEDCAQAHGCLYKDKHVGTFGDFGCFSFYPGKNLGALGDAGAIVCNNDGNAEQCRLIANHGRIQKYDHKIVGRNSRMDALQASFLSVKLKRLPNWNERRRRAAKIYEKRLTSVKEIVLPKSKPWARHAYHLYVVRLENRETVVKSLNDDGVETGIHYPIALPKMAAFNFIAQVCDDFFANQVDSQLLSLPMGPHLDDWQVEFVCDKLISAIQQVDKNH